ncbi:MAG: LiaF domain-containing protein, partial [Actinomycetota bacterium]
AAAVGVLGGLLVLRNLGGVDVDAGLFLGGVLAVVGAGIVVSAFTRRALILFPIAAVLTFLLAFSPLIDTTATGGVGARDLRVRAEDLQSSYSLGAGELLIDLRQLELAEDRRVEVSVGAGYTEIRLPADLPVRVEAASRFGYVEVLGVVEEGVGSEVTVVGEPDDPQPGTLTLVPSVTFGYVEVTRG